MRRELVEHLGLHLVEVMQPDLPALGSGGQVHRAGCRPIPREVDQRTSAPSSVIASSAAGAPLGGTPVTRAKLTTDEIDNVKAADRYRCLTRYLPRATKRHQAPPSATKHHRVPPSAADA